MTRRSLWLGLRVGIVLGLVVAVARVVRARRDLAPAPSSEPWEPLAPRVPPATGAPPLPPTTEVAVRSAPPTRAPEPAGRPAQLDVAPPGAGHLAPEPAPALAEAPTPAPPEAEPAADPAADPAPGDPAADPAPADPAAGEAVAVVAGQPAGEVAPRTVAGEPLVQDAEATKKAAPANRKGAGAKKAAGPGRAPAAKKAAPVAPWVDPEAGICPQTHPVKAKLSSKLFHLPGMFAYDRTRPDRCYTDASTAEADGFTRAKR